MYLRGHNWIKQMALLWVSLILMGSHSLWASEASKAMLAADIYQEELQEALHSYTSEHMFVTISQQTYGGASYYLTHIVIDSPSQIHAGLSHDTYGGEREKPTDASKRLGWIVGINAGNFSYSSGGGDRNMGNIIIKNGEIMADSGQKSNGMEICLSSGGIIREAVEGESAQELIEQGVTDTFTCGDTPLIKGGVRIHTDIQSQQYRYPRTAVGMVEAGEYYLVTAGSGSYGGGATYDEIRDILWERGCMFAKCMDGGGSSALVFGHELINVPAGGSERAVSDFLYFTDVPEGTELTSEEYFPDLDGVGILWEDIPEGVFFNEDIGDDGLVSLGD